MQEEVNYGGFCHNRVPNSYSDDDRADPTVELVV